MTYVLINSSNGIIVAYANSGSLRSIATFSGCELPDIQKIDLDEWRETYGGDVPAELDILDVGYWYLNDAQESCYQQPEYEWRKEYRSKINYND